MSSSGIERGEEEATEGMVAQKLPGGAVLGALLDGQGGRGGAPAPRDSEKSSGAAQRSVRASPGEGGTGSSKAAAAARKGQEGVRTGGGAAGRGPLGVSAGAGARAGAAQPSARERQEKMGGEEVGVKVGVVLPLFVVRVELGVPQAEPVPEGVPVPVGVPEGVGVGVVLLLKEALLE